MNIRISIVIPTYNRRDVLLETVGSLARQNAPEGCYEVLVVSDGSTDGTYEAVQELAARPPWSGATPLRCFQQENSGASAARNYGIREAAGEIVLLLDDDMTADPNLVQAHLDAHAGAPGRSVVLGNIVQQEVEGALHRQLHSAFSNRNERLQGETPIFKDLYTGNVSFPKEDALQAGGLDESLRYGEDVEFGARLMMEGLRFVYAPAAVSVHRDPKSPAAVLADFGRSGAGCVQIWQQRPDLLSGLPLSAYGETSLRLRLARRVLLVLSEVPLGARAIEWLCLKWATSDASEQISRSVFELVRSYYFWGGVRSVASRKDWKHLTDPGAVILMYHSICSQGEGSRYVMPRRRFELQMRLLRLLGRRVLPLGRSVALWKAGKMTPPRTVAITFDDGYRNTLTEAKPVLRRQGFPATLFLVAGKVGGENDWESPDVERRPLVSWHEAQRLDREGIAVESHGMEHLKLTSVPLESALRDLQESRVLLSQCLGREVRLLAYPYGSSNESVAAAAEEAGYEAALTVREGMNTLRTPRFSLKRVEIVGDEGVVMFVIKVLLGEDPFRSLKRRGRGKRR